MFSLQIISGFIAGLLGVVLYIPYIRSIFRGETKPNRASYGIWTLIGIVEVVSYYAAGAGSTLLLPLVYAIGSCIVFILSFKRGVGGLSKLDVFCVIGAIVGVLGWLYTKNPAFALYFSVAASLFGFIPTLKKTYLYPYTEDRTAWVMGGIAGVVNMFALSSLAANELIVPLYYLFADGAMALLVLYRRPNKPKLLKNGKRIKNEPKR